MSRYVLWTAVLMALIGALGCRCCPCLDHYGDAIDGVTDVDVAFDAWYCPHCDISRAGKPDWCGPLHRWMCPCRCQSGCWGRFNECWLYPPGYPYDYPAQALYDIGQAARPAAEEMLPDVPTIDLLSPQPPAAPPALPPAPPPNGATPPPPPIPEGWRPRSGFDVR
jgi:hypothetical protein